MNPINPKYLKRCLLILVISFFTTMIFAQPGGYWPPNDQEGAGGRSRNSSARMGSFSLIIQDQDQDSILLIDFNSFDDLKKAQQSFNIKLGANYNVISGEQGPGLNFDNNFFVSLSLSNRPLSFTFLDDFLSAVQITDSSIPNPQNFVFVKQTKYYWEPELALSFTNVESQGSFDLTYLDMFPLVFKRNIHVWENSGMFLSLGAGIGASLLLNSSADDRDFQMASMFKASYYFNSPWHAEIRYSFRQLQLDGQETPLNTFQLAIGYTINGGKGEDLFKRRTGRGKEAPSPEN